MHSLLLFRTLMICLLLLTGLSHSAGAQNWPEIFDPFEVRRLNLDISPADWETIQHDESLSIELPGIFWMDGESPILVGVRRKSGDPLNEAGGFTKVSLKIDINEYVSGQTWHDLKKLSLENGDDQDVVSEGYAWQIQRLASGATGYGYPAGHGSWVTLAINGVDTGVYLHAEQRDKQFLRNRDLYTAGATWLYKISDIGQHSLAVGSGDSPTELALCYSPFHSGGDACPQPASDDFVFELNALIDMQGMLTMAAVTTLIGNGDALFTHGKNCFYVDFLNGDRRMYFPWDLDATIGGNPGGSWPSGSDYAGEILGSPLFLNHYEQIMGNLLGGPLSESNLMSLLDAMEPVLTDLVAADPNNQIGSDVADHFESLRNWTRNRIADITADIPANTAAPLPPALAALDQNHPNPFNPATRIGFSLERGSFVTLTVHDIEGRLLRTLLSAEMTAGHHEIDWNGRDDLARELPTGVYFSRLQAQGEIHKSKMLLLR
jgi:hypothetical protein